MQMPAIIPSGSMLADFADGLRRDDPVIELRHGLVGSDAMVDGPFGPKPLLYADYVASGRALMQVERFMLERVLPFYANSHTEASYCGGLITRLRRDARATIGACCGATSDHAVIFAGSGATAGINRLVNLFDVGPQALVIIGPYEHHSNILPWRESGAELIELPEAADGGPDITAFQAALDGAAPGRRVVCAFSAASNVTGITADVARITRMANAAGARVIWDYAGGAPYLKISIQPAADAAIDAIVVSPHKFLGGPGASGVLIVRRDAVLRDGPSWPGGGTVRFVSPTAHDYSTSVEAREEAGTPNVVGDIRAALAFIVKEAIGEERMARRNDELAARAFAAWLPVPQIELLGSRSAHRLPIFSFRVRDGRGGYVHQQLVTRMLSDRFGIQARGGCACAGPYVHRLLGIGDDESEAIRKAIIAGEETTKPGFTRLNFSVLLSDDKVEFILRSVAELASDAGHFIDRYDCDRSRAIFFPRAA
ncbi:MAG: aminotransferase class V-fold PLP-dependent enzyme [Rhizobiaceae bacterium]|nr:aminotransferase class V-fold PLP-dependent enzyme [Rhizobiaceae bacterium]